MSLQCTKTILKTTCSIHKQAHSTPNRLGLQPPRLGLQPLRVGLQPHWQGQPHMAGFIASAGQPPVGGCIAPLGQIYSLPAPESALMYTQCTRNMLGTTFVSHTEHRQNREKQENHVCFTVTQGNRNCQPLQRHQKRPRGINIACKCSNVHPTYPQYARNNFCQPYPALENTTTSSKSRKTRKSRCFTVTQGNRNCQPIQRPPKRPRGINID